MRGHAALNLSQPSLFHLQMPTSKHFETPGRVRNKLFKKAEKFVS